MCCLAFARAQLGGMGFVHYNNTVEEQVAHVTRVKRHQPGYLASPLILTAQDTISKIDQLMVRGPPASPQPARPQRCVLAVAPA